MKAKKVLKNIAALSVATVIVGSTLSPISALGSSKDLTELIRLFDTIKGKLSISKSATEVSGDNIFYPSEIFKETLPKCIGNGRYKIRYEVIQENSYLLVEEGVLDGFNSIW